MLVFVSQSRYHKDNFFQAVIKYLKDYKYWDKFQSLGLFNLNYTSPPSSDDEDEPENTNTNMTYNNITTPSIVPQHDKNIKSTTVKDNTAPTKKITKHQPIKNN